MINRVTSPVAVVLMRIDEVPKPTIREPADAIVRVTSSGPCGSDVHLDDGPVTHRLPLEQAPAARGAFRAKRDGVVEMLFQP